MSNLAEIPNECFDAPTEAPDALDTLLADPWLCVEQMSQQDKDDMLYSYFLGIAKYVKTGRIEDRNSIGAVGYERGFAAMKAVAGDMSE